MSNSPQRIYINGRFLSKKKITGTERFSLEIVRHLDTLLGEQKPQVRVDILAPPDALAPSWLKNIGFVRVGTHKGHVWEQFDLFCAASDGFLVNLSACAPLFKRDQVTVVHDATIYRYPRNFSWAYRVWHKIIDFFLARFSRLATVSEFSRGELSEILRVDASEILVLPNGHEHILEIVPDSSVVERLGLQKRPYFVFVGSPTPIKNLPNAIKGFQLLNEPDAAFVIVGSANKHLFKGSVKELPANVIMPGRLSDAEVVGLLKSAKAMVFPSLYEGFGIPPLEAMAHGCPVIASKIPPVMEVCGDAASYFDPTSPEDIAAGMQKVLSAAFPQSDLASGAQKRLGLFSWRKSAEALLASCFVNDQREMCRL